MNITDSNYVNSLQKKKKNRISSMSRLTWASSKCDFPFERSNRGRHRWSHVIFASWVHAWTRAAKISQRYMKKTDEAGASSNVNSPFFETTAALEILVVSAQNWSSSTVSHLAESVQVTDTQPRNCLPTPTTATHWPQILTPAAPIGRKAI